MENIVYYVICETIFPRVDPRSDASRIHMHTYVYHFIYCRRPEAFSCRDHSSVERIYFVSYSCPLTIIINNGNKYNRALPRFYCYIIMHFYLWHLYDIINAAAYWSLLRRSVLRNGMHQPWVPTRFSEPIAWHEYSGDCKNRAPIVFGVGSLLLFCFYFATNVPWLRSVPPRAAPFRLRECIDKQNTPRRTRAVISTPFRWIWTGDGIRIKRESNRSHGRGGKNVLYAYGFARGRFYNYGGLAVTVPWRKRGYFRYLGHLVTVSCAAGVVRARPEYNCAIKLGYRLDGLRLGHILRYFHAD